MSYYSRQWVFLGLMLLMTILHVDAWSWHRLHPLLAGWLPYEMWYRMLLTLLSAALFWLLARWIWPEPDASLLVSAEEEGRSQVDG